VRGTGFLSGTIETRFPKKTNRVGRVRFRRFGDKIRPYTCPPDWLVLPAGNGAAMLRVNVNEFYTLGFILHPLGDIRAGKQIKDYYNLLYQAQNALDGISNDSLVPLGVARPACDELLSAIRELLRPEYIDDIPSGASPQLNMEKSITPIDEYAITNGLRTFETVMGAQLQSLSMYFVSRKLGYDTPVLIEEAERLLPEEIWKDVPDAIYDVQQAGKCIAFDIPTAAGFHIIRATEAVIRRYYAAAVGSVPKIKNRNWGAYTKRLGEAGADPRVTQFLDHIRVTYRNPISHPDAALTPVDAVFLVGACISAIALMVSSMKAIPPRPTVASA
jgi:hypothetical protein